MDVIVLEDAKQLPGVYMSVIADFLERHLCRGAVDLLVYLDVKHQTRRRVLLVRRRSQHPRNPDGRLDR